MPREAVRFEFPEEVVSDRMLLLARTTPLDQVEKKTDGLSVFLLDMKAAGDRLDIRSIKTMINHATTEVFLGFGRVPANALIGEEGQGFRCILDGLNAERILSLRSASATGAGSSTATGSPPSTTSSASSASLGSIPSRPSRTTSCSPISASTCSGCRDRSELLGRHIRGGDAAVDH